MALKQFEPKKIYIQKASNMADMRGPCPSGFHVPSKDEWVALVNAGVDDGAWTSSGGINISTYLKLPFNGRRNGESGNVQFQGTYGFYWSSTYSLNPGRGYILNIESNAIYPNADNPIPFGNGIRPFKDTPIAPDSGWTALYSDKIYHNSTLGLISIRNGTNWITISDKNLGATTVYNNGDTLSESNCGKYYQRGNNYGFPFTGTVTTSSTQVDASTYGPGNYYESSTFITSNPRDSSNNTNLRGGESSLGGEKEVKSVYIGSTKVRPIDKRTFTITWTETSSPTSFSPTYSDDAAGLTAGSTAFDEFFGYYGCRLSSAGVETAKVEQSSPGTLDITQLGTLSSGDNVMIAFPRRGIKMSKSGTQVTLSITADPNKAGYQYYAHTKGSDVKNVLYLGAYKICYGYKTLSEYLPERSKTRAQFRSGIKSTYDSIAGTDRYSQITIYPRWYINALYMMKYGNPNSQGLIGQGYTGASGSGRAPQATGATNSITNATGATSTGATGRIKLFGLEDWWGNIEEFMDGCWVSVSKQLTVSKTNSSLIDNSYSTNLGEMSPGFIVGIDGSNDGMFRCTNASGGSATTYYTDSCNSYSSSRVLTAGGLWNTSTSAGAFHINETTSSDYQNYMSSRLMYI